MHQHSSQFELKIRISGEAGDGILTAGDILMSTVSRLGYHSSVYKSIPSNIRGGYSQSTVSISEQDIISPVSFFDILILLSETVSDLEPACLSKCKFILVESECLKNNILSAKIAQCKQLGITVHTIHIKEVVRNINKCNSICSVVIIGFLCRLLQIPTGLIEDQITDQFQSKGNTVIQDNISAFKAGILRAQTDITPLHSALKKITTGDEKRIILDGNQALCLGAIEAGATFFASYPITPATSIGDSLSKYLLGFDGFSYQAEDEIAAIGAVIGASFCGSKAFTATSGPGLSLMQEFIGYASMTEIPIVIIDVQRAGPSTGMSTKHAQDDLLASVFGGHGEGQRIIVAPSGIRDCFFTAVIAFNLSEQYQCPVILLSDASMAMIKQTIDYPDLDSIKKIQRPVLKNCIKENPFQRYKINQDGLKPIPVPGISPVSYRVTGLEHDEASFPSVNGELHSMQMKRRSEKLLNIEQDYSNLLEWDLEDENIYNADFSLIAWGITASISRKAIYNMRKNGFKIAALYPKLLFPVAKQSIDKLLKFSEKLFIPESNFSGQYSMLVRIYTDAKPHPITISRNEPFTSNEIETYITMRLHHEH